MSAAGHVLVSVQDPFIARQMRAQPIVALPLSLPLYLPYSAAAGNVFTAAALATTYSPDG